MRTTDEKNLTVVVLPAVGLLMALLVGLVRSADRGSEDLRIVAEVAPAGAGTARVSLRTPVQPAPATSTPAPVEEPRAAAPESTVARRGLTRLVGVVMRPEGEPAANARVVLGHHQVRCDPDGTFEIALTSDPGASDLLAHEPGYEPRLRPAFGSSLRPNTDNQVRLVLGPSTYALRGTVMGFDGRPLKGWTVELDGLDPLATFGLREPARTDAEGAFLIGEVPAGIHVLRAFRERREEATRSAPVAAGEMGVTIMIDERAGS